MTMRFCNAVILSSLLFPTPLLAEEPIQKKVGVVVGLTAGNIVAVPAKALAVSIGAAAGILSFIFTGGDTEVTRQAWQNSTAGPYLITPEVAEKALGDRPQLREKEISALNK